MIVTGASSGIGRALAERAARSGFDVFAVGRRAERLDELAHAVREASGELFTLALDLQTPDAATRIVAETVAHFGRIDVLVNCAGGTAVGTIAGQSDDELREQFVTHAIVPLQLTREALPYLRAAKGQIVYFGSGVARIPVGGLGAYPPAKAAVRSMTRVVRNELRADGIAVTYVDPGAVATEFMTRAGFAGPPKLLAASPNTVARAIFEAILKRRSVVNAVGWQTTFVAFGEMLPNLTDFILRLAPGIVGTAPKSESRESASDVASASFELDRFHHASANGSTGAVSHDDLASATNATAQVQAEPPKTIVDEPIAIPETDLVESPAESGAANAIEPEPPAVLVSAGPSEAPPVEKTELEIALESVARRMQKLHLSLEFLHALLEPGSELDVGEVAMRWAGMPSKIERNLTRDVLAALTVAGFVSDEGDDRYRVLRAG
jgi:short-subunit dehydrogenase